MGDPTRRPTEEDYLQYFDYLHTEKKQEASSIWAIYSSLNSIHQREFAEKLQVYPRVTQLLKRYNDTYVRKVAKVFEVEQIDDFFRMELNTAYWIVRKAVVAIAICGGLRDGRERTPDQGSPKILRKPTDGENLPCKYWQRCRPLIEARRSRTVHWALFSAHSGHNGRRRGSDYPATTKSVWVD